MTKNPLEWSVFTVSLGLVAACLGILGYEQLTRTDLPPSLTVAVGQVLTRPDGFAVELVVRNSGDHTAAAVRLAVAIDGQDADTGAVIEYVPYGSTRRAWIMLRDDPRRRALTVRVLGYEEP